MIPVKVHTKAAAPRIVHPVQWLERLQYTPKQRKLCISHKPIKQIYTIATLAVAAAASASTKTLTTANLIMVTLGPASELEIAKQTIVMRTGINTFANKREEHIHRTHAYKYIVSHYIDYIHII